MIPENPRKIWPNLRNSKYFSFLMLQASTACPIEKYVGRETKTPSCGPFFNTQNTDFPSVYFSTGLLKG